MKCAFCGLVTNLKRKVGENDLAWAFLTYTPITPGHTLIVPKRCVPNYEDLTDEEVLAIRDLTLKVQNSLRKTFNAKGFNFAWNQGKDFGQSVPHYHLHIVPRNKDDNGIVNYEPREFLYRPESREKTPESELEKVAKLIASNLEKMKVLLLDADGVLIDDAEIFLDAFEKIYNVDESKLLDFFRGEFRESIIDNKNLKDILPKYLKEWNINDSVDNFLLNWFESENKPRNELIHFVKNLNANVFIATNQERNRTKYLMEDMKFNEFAREIFSSYMFKIRKPNLKFYEKVFEKLQKYFPDLKPDEVLFFDDSIKNVQGANEFGFKAFQYKNFKNCKKIIEENFN